MIEAFSCITNALSFPSSSVYIELQFISYSKSHVLSSSHSMNTQDKLLVRLEEYEPEAATSPEDEASTLTREKE